MRQPKPMVRKNTRIREDQDKFIKAQAKKLKKTEGEVFRAVIDGAMPMKNNWKKK